MSRLGSNSHYFTIQALRRHNMEPVRDYTFLQIGGDPETLTALMGGGIDIACLAAPTDAQAIARGYHYVIYGPDLRIPYVSTAFVTKRSTIAKRPQVIGELHACHGRSVENPAHRPRIRLQGLGQKSQDHRIEVFSTRRITQRSKPWSRV